MGVIIPQVVTEDRAGGGQIIDGGLRFDSGKSQHLTRTPSNVGNRRTFTWSGWVKRNKLGTYQYLLSAYQSGSYRASLLFNNDETLNFALGNTSPTITTTAVFRDISSWYHIVVSIDTTQATQSNGMKLYVNGVLQVATNSGTYTQNDESWINTTNAHLFGYPGNYYLDTQLSNVYFIDGQALDPSYFGFTDPLTNTWRPKKLSSSVAFGTNGFYLPLDGNSPIGQDRSGNNNNWTPVNFGGSNTIEKATGALPILNTDGGGKVARVGVRTDTNASSLVLALPLVGIKSDFSNAVNSGTSNKVVTANGNAAASSAQSNFYGGSFAFDGNGTTGLTVTYTSDFDCSGTFTSECWVYGTQLGAYNPIICQWSSDGTGTDAWTLETVGTALRLYVTDISYIEDPAPFALNRWQHFAVVYNGGTLSLYRDGVLVGSASRTISASTLNYTVGRFHNTESSGRTWYGYIQDVKHYKGIAKYTQNFIPASTDPDILPDTPSGVAYSSNVALVPSTDGGSVGFDGSGDYLNVGTSSDYAFGTGDFTMECFVYHNDLTGQQTYFSDAYGNSAGIYFCKREPANGNVLAIYTTTFIVTGSSPLSSGRWHHIAVCRSSGTIRLFLNGVLDGSASDTTNLTQTQYSIGESFDGTSGGMNGFISNAHIVKGTALYTSNFTPPTAPITSVANTKLLCCKSNSSATAFDVSPGTITANGNAAPTNFNPFNVNINTQRGQESGYCTLNPLDAQSGTTTRNGNLTAVTNSSTSGTIRGTVGVSTGKWYWEVLFDPSGGNYGPFIGIMPPEDPITNYPGQSSISYSIYSEGSSYKKKYNNGLVGDYGTGFVIGDIIGVAFDATNGTLECYRNGISEGVAFTGIPSRTYLPAVADGTSAGGATLAANFGQKPFKFPPPAGFQPLALANTPSPSIVRPDQYVGISTWTGDGNSTRSISNYSFKPDFIWIKNRDSSSNHALIDTVRGTGAKVLCSDQTYADNDYGLTVSSFDRTGFTVATGSINFSYANSSTNRYVGWAWKAGGNSNTYNINDIGYSIASAAGLTAGTITPTGASVNTKSGFSIITYTGTGANATISHGLGNAPSFVICKRRDTTGAWVTWHKSLTDATYYVLLNSSTGQSNTSGTLNWNSTAPSSTVISLGTSSDTNNLNGTFCIYAWAEIPGFSKFGSVTLSASANDAFIWTGFRPRWFLLKGTGSNWIILDSTRDPFNFVDNELFANLSNAENAATSTYSFDFLSNGIKCRNQGLTGAFIYAAFAEAPSFNLYGGQSNAR